MKISKLSKPALVSAAALSAAANTLAGVFVITDDACPASKGDLEAHLNWESTIATDHGKAVSSAPSLELAYGATETLEIAFSLDFGHDYVGRGRARKLDESHVNDLNFTGISVGLKNQILDPENAENPFGLAFVGGFSWAWAATNQDSARDLTFELGLNFQKNLLDGDLILAFTPGVALTSVKGDKAETGSSDSTFDSTEYTLAAGASYQLAEGWRVGLEGVWSIAYDADGYADDQFYAGPNVCYEADSWWFTACVAPRLFSTADEVIVSAQIGYVF